MVSKNQMEGNLIGDTSNLFIRSLYIKQFSRMLFVSFLYLFL